MRRLALLTLLFVACSGGEPESTRYVQTWEKPYGETSCREFTQQMTRQQSFVLAGDMLVRAQRTTEPDAVPSDEQIEAFSLALTVACAEWPIAESMTMPEVAATRYQMDDEFKP